MSFKIWPPTEIKGQLFLITFIYFVKHVNIF